jgi:hypothetical protein
MVQQVFKDVHKDRETLILKFGGKDALQVTIEDKEDRGRLENFLNNSVIV